ncbi:Nucleoporin NUP188 [Geodia barretti]|uniref:Nucleoporin NUP188 n=1 Tax=Geodia barretti TaxID=519541 RepID=A0AA35RN21_GEOBA|nr:Nucleoporin NUP188 [Geodia barretti]
MAASSNRSLWRVVTGHSALRDHALIERELRDSLTRLREGVAYYRPPCPASEKKIRDGGKLKGNKLTLVLEISSHLQLDQEQAPDLFEGFLINAHLGTLGELRERVRSEGGRREVVEEVASYYHSERLHLLRCLKHMLGFWQDPNHPFRDVYSVCIGEITKDEKSFIKSLWSQYQAAVDNDLPSQLSVSEETQWSVQRLVEQVELLEAILLYYKDFVHEGAELVCHAQQLWKNGCGLRQSCPVSLVDGAELLQRHIGHLCSLILVESLDLESILAHLEDPGCLEDHHLLKSDSSSEVEQLDNLFSKWGDQDCLTPVLLSWALLQFAKQQSHTDLEDVRLLGNRALSGGVFQYVRCLLGSPFFSRERPVGGACRSVLHALLALALSQFSDDSLGDRQDLVAIASLTLTHPPLRLQFWDQGLSVGVGLLVNSSLSHFPSSSSLTSLLLSLAGDQVSAGHVWQLLASLPRFTEKLPHREIGTQVKVVTADEGEAPMLKVIKPRSFYTSEARWLGLHGVVLGNGVCGEVWEGWEGEELVSWPLPHSVSGWDLLALEIVRLLQTCPLDSSTDVLVARVTGSIRLVTQLVKSDWSLAAELHHITSQAFSMVQRFAALPRPPTTLLASCVSCLAVMATNNTAETWLTLGQTGFLPYLSSSLPPSHDNLECLSVAPGNYGQLLKMAECPEGGYPVTMAMLDLLATTCLPGNSVVLREQLATVIYIMREVFLSCHKWKFKLRSGRRQLELGLLRFCHDTLQRHRDSPFSLGVVVATQLLSCPGEQGLLPLLSLPVSTLNSLHSAALGTSSVSPAVESVRLSLSILNLLLHAPPTQQSSLLEWNLANTYPHIVSNIASYIYHYGDSRIPIGATAVLTRLCQATPLSVFSCLGTDAVVKRDVFISRLSSRVEV